MTMKNSLQVSYHEWNRKCLQSPFCLPLLNNDLHASCVYANLSRITVPSGSYTSSFRLCFNIKWKDLSSVYLNMNKQSRELKCWQGLFDTNNDYRVIGENWVIISCFNCPFARSKKIELVSLNPLYNRHTFVYTM